MKDIKENKYILIIRWIARIWAIIILLIALIFLAGYLYNWITIGCTANPY